MKEKLTDKQVLDKIETYIRLTKLPDSSRYDMATSELFALMHMEQKTDPILWAYSRDHRAGNHPPDARRPLQSVTENRQQSSRPENGAAVPISADIDSESRFPQVKTKFHQVES